MYAWDLAVLPHRKNLAPRWEFIRSGRKLWPKYKVQFLSVYLIVTFQTSTQWLWILHLIRLERKMNKWIPAESALLWHLSLLQPESEKSFCSRQQGKYLMQPLFPHWHLRIFNVEHNLLSIGFNNCRGFDDKPAVSWRRSVMLRRRERRPFDKQIV